ncbi:diguanylate cyclase [Crocosphaera sp.]|uniref:diguanylate cyclase n=1 Tax=Crocosphaera sp. TaxID=2729996 RepID=UPI003F221021|nr:diguanylate cyclase [Crocosphaera sp.]
MFRSTSLEALLDDSEIHSLVSDLISLINLPTSIEDVNGNLLLGESPTTTLPEEHLIMLNQQMIGLVKGDTTTHIITRLLSYLVNQEQLVLFDELTKIPNYRYFNRYLQQECKRGQREKIPLSLLLFDIDHFRMYNNYYGHPQGNICLKKVAQIIQDTLKRPGDLVFRYGGEEFAVILPNTPSQGAEFMAEQIIERIQGQQITHYTSPTSSYLTVSLGIAVTTPTINTSTQTLVKIADDALYAAKKTGRNRYCLQIIS